MSVTMREIAAAAQVSVSTVSRVLNGNPAISERRSKVVLDAADRLNYRRKSPSSVCDPLAILQERRVGIVSLGMSPRLLALPTVARTINGAEEALSSAGARVTLRHMSHVEDCTDNTLGDLDALVLIGALHGEVTDNIPQGQLARINELPSVWMLGRPAGCTGDVVAPNAFETGSSAAEYLVERGHKNLAFLSPKPAHQQFMAREDGFVSRARRLGATVQIFSEDPPDGWPYPLQPPTDVATVQKLVDAILQATPRPTAVFAAADSVAALTYRALAERSVVVGRDISVISANNDEAWIAALHPGLTTFDVHAEQLGRSAVRQLANRLCSRNSEPTLDLTFSATLIERESVADLRNAK